MSEERDLCAEDISRLKRDVEDILTAFEPVVESTPGVIDAIFKVNIALDELADKIRRGDT